MTLPSERTRIMRDGLTATAERLLALIKARGGRLAGDEIGFMRLLQEHYPEHGRPTLGQVHHALRYLHITGRIHAQWGTRKIDVKLNREQKQ